MTNLGDYSWRFRLQVQTVRGWRPGFSRFRKKPPKGGTPTQRPAAKSGGTGWRDKATRSGLFNWADDPQEPWDEQVGNDAMAAGVGMKAVGEVVEPAGVLLEGIVHVD